MDHPVPKFSEVQAGPLALTPRNCEGQVGLEWRQVLKLAGELGVPTVKAGTKRIVPAQAFLEALLRHRIDTPATPVAPEPGSVAELEAMRAKLRAGGGRRG